MLKAHVIEIMKACLAVFMKARNSLVVWCRVRKSTEDSENGFFKALAKKFFVNMEMLFMADLLPNGLHEKVMIFSNCYITKSRLDLQLFKEIPLEKFSRWKKRGRGMISKLIMVFTLNISFICYLSRIVINVLRTSSMK